MISVMAQPLQLLLPNKCQQIKKTTEKETRKCVSKECYQERERDKKKLIKYSSSVVVRIPGPFLCSQVLCAPHAIVFYVRILLMVFIGKIHCI